jgi:neutral ceramidase
MTTVLLAGAGRADISPAKGTYLAGYGHPFRTSKSVRDPLSATVLTLDDGATRLALVTLDALSVHEDIVARLREAVCQHANVPVAHVMIACSHSHCSPVLSALEDSSEHQRAHVEMTVTRVAEAARDAAEQMTSATLHVGRGHNTIAVNRRETNAKGETVIGVVADGPIDPDLLVLQVRGQDGSVIATIVNLACHPTCLSPKHRIATAAWPGQMRAVVEAETHTPVLFMQGATGDMNPDASWGRGELDAMIRLGTTVGQATLEVLTQLSEVSGVPLAAERVDVFLPITAEEGPGGTPLDHLDGLRKKIPLPRFAIRWLLNRCYPWRTRQTITAEGHPAVPMETQVLRLGEVALVGWAAEVFHGLAVAMKEGSPATMTFFAGYSNGMIGYLPTADEHARGGYEVDVSPYFYRLGGRLDPSAGERASEQSRELLERLFSQT